MSRALLNRCAKYAMKRFQKKNTKNYLFKMKELNGIVLRKVLFFSIKGQFFLEKGTWVIKKGRWRSNTSLIGSCF